MTARFYVPDLSTDSRDVKLPDEEADHLRRVLRLRAGARVAVFDGRGREFLAAVTSVSRDEVIVRPDTPFAAVAEGSVRITLAQAVIKSDRMDAVVRDAVMMGASALQPLVTSRTTISLHALDRARRVERWQRIAISSAKQCGRAVVPRVSQAVSFDDFLSGNDAALTVMLVEPAVKAASQATLRALRERPKPPTATIVIGPEGGWSADEIALVLGRDVVLQTLGSRTLRADAVPLVALTMLQFLWDEL